MLQDLSPEDASFSNLSFPEEQKVTSLQKHHTTLHTKHNFSTRLKLKLQRNLTSRFEDATPLTVGLCDLFPKQTHET